MASDVGGGKSVGQTFDATNGSKSKYGDSAILITPIIYSGVADHLRLTAPHFACIMASSDGYPFPGGLIYLHPSEAHKLRDVLRVSETPIEDRRMPRDQRFTPIDNLSTARAFSPHPTPHFQLGATTSDTRSDPCPWNVKQFIAALRMPQFRRPSQQKRLRDVSPSPHGKGTVDLRDNLKKILKRTGRNAACLIR